jgi:pimeloyl-ACP methyl ester carboxylesterase
VFARFGPESGRALFESMFWMFDAERAAHVNAIDVAVPLLCLAGGRDKVISPATVRNIAAKYPELATYVEFDDIGHMMPLEPGWPAVAETCLEWLDTLPP